MRSAGLQNQSKIGCVENTSLGSDKFLIINYSWDWTTKKNLILFCKTCNIKDEVTETFSAYNFSDKCPSDKFFPFLLKLKFIMFFENLVAFNAVKMEADALVNGLLQQGKIHGS